MTIQHAPALHPTVRHDGAARATVTSTVSLVIPTLNEERNIAAVLRQVPDLVDEIIIVDGRSKDRTVETALAIRPDARIVMETAPGKGSAVRAGFAAARGDLVVMIDADCSMDPGDIESYVTRLAAGADVVKGSRFLPGGGTTDMTLLRRGGNHVLVTLVNALYGSSFSELCYGYMAFRRSRLQDLDLRSPGFEIETEIVVRALKQGLRIEEVPSFEKPRAFGESNLNTFRDGWRVLRKLLVERFTSSQPIAVADRLDID